LKYDGVILHVFIRHQHCNAHNGAIAHCMG
jgi:hypothetical protein